MKKRNSRKGQALWKTAKQFIPGGNQLLSKRSEMFLPEHWPAYFKRAKGVEVWDLDNNHYIDMSIMGMGTCILGYADPGVNKAVKRAVDQGSMSTLNCPEEVELARQLTKLHPWADMVRFSRSGGEACAMAIRIARAQTTKDKIAFCGYHGWHDWYLAANLSDQRHLDGQLLPGLQPQGVPQGLRGTMLPFHYGRSDELEKIVSRYDIGTIIMEVARNNVDLPFLQKVQGISRKIKAVLVYDEVTSGFRHCPGGLHLQYNLEPDVVVLGKAMGNGFPIAAVVGKRFVMDAAQETFISSTFWSERIGFVAALEVIRQLQARKINDYLCKTGRQLKKQLEGILSKTVPEIKISGLDPAPAISFPGNQEGMIMKTFYTQEMLKMGYLAGGLIYLSKAHNKTIIAPFLRAFREVLTEMYKLKQQGTLAKNLAGPVCHSGFSRLTS